MPSPTRVGAAVVIGALTVLTAACSTGSQPSAATTPIVGTPSPGSSSPAQPPANPASASPAGPAQPSASPASGKAASASPAGASPLATEVNPPGDIPDNQAYVRYPVPGSGVSVKFPEGWSRSTSGAATTFTSKLNSITIAVSKAASPPTAASVQAAAARELPGAVQQYAPGKLSTIQRAGQSVQLFTYTGDSTPDPVTSKVVRDSFEQYTYFKAGTRVVLTLTGPTNADNVDPWRTVADSVMFQ